MSLAYPATAGEDGTSLRVLFLDDSPDDAFAILRELRKGGFEVFPDVVQSVEELAACVRAKQHDLILSDYRLPAGNGMEALAVLKKEGQDIPFILVTGALVEEEAVECLKQGATDFVLKHRLSRLIPVVRRALAEKRLREAEKRARDSLANLAAIVESSHEAIVGSNAEGVVTSWNSGAERLYGYTAEEALGRSMSLIVPPERLHEKPVLLGRPERRKNPRVGETVRLTKDGRRIPVLVAVSPVRNERGEIRGVSEIAHDITHFKEEEQLRSRNRHLEEQNRLVLEADRAKSRFLANMSHELRSPLNCIIGFAELLYDGKLGPVAEPHLEFLGDILHSAQHLLRLVSEVLDLSRVESGRTEFNIEPLDLEALVREVVQALQPVALKKTIRMDTDVASDIGTVVVDATRVKQILHNYLSNALKFTPEGGCVAVRARLDPPDHFLLQVEDNGIGIAAEDAGRLFREFQQLDDSPARQHEGIGLGLALTKRIVEAQGGWVWACSTPGEGSSFYAVLPRVFLERPALPEAGQHPLPINGNSAARWREVQQSWLTNQS